MILCTHGRSAYHRLMYCHVLSKPMSICHSRVCWKCFRFAHPAEANQSSETRDQRPETIRSEKIIGMLSESQWNVNGKARVSHRKVIGRSSGSHRKVIRKSSESHRNVIGMSSERHPQNARRFYAVSLENDILKHSRS